MNTPLYVAALMSQLEQKGKSVDVTIFIPILPNFSILAPFAPMYRTLAGLGMAIAVLAGIAGIILGLIKFTISGNKREGHEGAARMVRNGFIAVVGAFIVSVVIIAVAAVATALK